MKFIILGKNIDVTEGLRSAVEDKIGKLEKYFAEDTEVHVTLSVEKDRQKIEVTIPVKGSIIRSEQVSNDMYVSIDLVEEVIEQQLKKYKKKIIDKHQNSENFQKAVTIPVKGSIIRSEQVSNDMYVSIDLVEEIIERQLKKYKTKLTDREQGASSFKQEYLDKDFMDEEEIKIIRTKKFDIKPMYPEDACVQMELLGHSFFVFCNAETDQVNVVYKRKGNTYGLIEPEV